MTNREMIEERCKREGLTIQGWSETEDGDTASPGRFLVVTPEYEDDGLYEGDSGELAACVVGAEKFGNRRVCFTFSPEGYDSGEEVHDLSVLDAVG